MFWWKRYEHILEKKPVSGKEAVLDLLAQELAEMCATFPPAEDAVEWVDMRLANRMQGQMASMPRMDQERVEVLCHVIALDLAHEQEELDHFMRNERYSHAFPTPMHRDVLLFLWHSAVELLLDTKDKLAENPNGNTLKRADLIEAVKRTPLQFRRRWLRQHLVLP